MIHHRFTLYDEAGAQLAQCSTDPKHTHPYLMEVTKGVESEVDLVGGRSVIGQYNLGVLDKRTVVGDQGTGWFTALLADASGETALIGRRAVLEETRNGGWDPALGVWTGDWTMVMDGVIGDISLDDSKVSYTLEVRDTREAERAARIFTRGGTASVFPRGVVNGYGKLPNGGWLVKPTVPWAGTFKAATGGGHVTLDAVEARKAERVVTDAMREAMKPRWSHAHNALIVPAVEVRWRAVGGTAWTTVKDLKAVEGMLTQVQSLFADMFVGLFSADRADYEVEGERQRVQLVNRVFLHPAGGGTLPADGARVEVIVVSVAEPSETYPLHIETTAGELLRRLYDGVYSEQPPSVRYDLDAVLALDEPVRARITSPAKDLRTWVEKNIYQPTGSAPALDAQGRVAPIRSALPADGAVIPTLAEDAVHFDESGWEHSGADAINRVSFTYLREYAVTAEADPLGARSAGDGIAAREVTVEFESEGSTALLGDQELSISPVTFRAVGGAEGQPVTGDAADETGHQLATARARQALDRFRYGGQYLRLRCRRSATADLRVGAWVIVDLAWLPDYQTGRRGGPRLAQIVSVKEADPAWRDLRLIDAGASAQPLPVPTLGLVSINADGVTTVPVAAIPAGAEVRVDLAVSETEPAAWSGLWMMIGRRGTVGDVLSAPVPAGRRVYVRARSEAQGRRPSAWVLPASQVAPASARLLSARLALGLSGDATAHYTANDLTASVRVYYATHAPGVDPTLTSYVDAAGASGSVAIPVTVEPGQALTVEVEPWTGAGATGTAGSRLQRSKERPAEVGRAPLASIVTLGASSGLRGAEMVRFEGESRDPFDNSLVWRWRGEHSATGPEANWSAPSSVTYPATADGWSTIPLPYDQSIARLPFWQQGVRLQVRDAAGRVGEAFYPIRSESRGLDESGGLVNEIEVMSTGFRIFGRDQHTLDDTLDSSVYRRVAEEYTDLEHRLTKVHKGGVPEPVDNLVKYLTDPIHDTQLSTNIPRKNEQNIFTDAVAVNRAVDSLAYSTKIGADAYARWKLNSSGVMWWSDGAFNYDTNLYRASAGVLATDNNLRTVGYTNANAFQINGVEIITSARNLQNTLVSATDINRGTLADARLTTNVPLKNADNLFTSRNRFTRAATGDVAHWIGLPTDTEPRHWVAATGTHWWGLGGTTIADTNLYRAAADYLKTDDTFSAYALAVGGVEVVSNARSLTNIVNATLSGTLDFGSRLGFHLKLYGDTYGFGIESGTMYARAGTAFKVYAGGVVPNGTSASPGDYHFYIDHTAASLRVPLNMNAQKITNVADPTALQDAATLSYVQSVAAGKTTYSDLWNDMLLWGAFVEIATIGTTVPQHLQIDGGAAYVGGRRADISSALIDIATLSGFAGAATATTYVLYMEGTTRTNSDGVETENYWVTWNIADANVGANGIVRAVAVFNWDQATGITNLRQKDAINGIFAGGVNLTDPYTAKLYAYIDSTLTQRTLIYLADDKAFWPAREGVDMGRSESWGYRWDRVYAQQLDVVPKAGYEAMKIHRWSGYPSIKGTDTWLIIDGWDANSNVTLNYYNAGNVYLAVGGGNVSIGKSSSAGYKLDVAGSIYGASLVVAGTATLGNNANAVQIKGGSADHVYAEFYARSAAQGTRSGYMGYASAGTSTFSFSNALGGDFSFDRQVAAPQFRATSNRYYTYGTENRLEGVSAWNQLHTYYGYIQFGPANLDYGHIRAINSSGNAVPIYFYETPLVNGYAVYTTATPVAITNQNNVFTTRQRIRGPLLGDHASWIPKVGYNLAWYNAGANVAGPLVVTTNMPKVGTSYMCRVVIEGYQYATNAGAWSLEVGFYNYGPTTGATFVNYAVTYSNHGFRPSVRLGANGSGNVVIVIGEGATFQYPQIRVASAQIGYNNPPDSLFDGWTISQVAQATVNAYTYLTSLQEMTNALYLGGYHATDYARTAASNTFTALQYSTLAAGSYTYASQQSGDANSRFARKTDGTMEWGDGTNARDTNLRRAGVSLLATDDDFTAYSVGVSTFLSAYSGVAANRGSSNNSGGVSLYQDTSQIQNYGIAFRGTGYWGQHGYVTPGTADWATYLTMAGSQLRGWIFRHATAGNVASINAYGEAWFNGQVRTSRANVYGDVYAYGALLTYDDTANGGVNGWGNTIIRGRVWSANSNIHLSPPSGSSVIVNTTYREAGGTTGGVAHLQASGDLQSRLGGQSMLMGLHPSYAGAASIWYNGNAHYNIHAESSHLWLNANASNGTVYLRAANVDLATFSASQTWIHGGRIQFRYTATNPWGFISAQDNFHIVQNAYYNGQWITIATGKAAVIQTGMSAGKALLVSSDLVSRNPGVARSFTERFIVYEDGRVWTQSNLDVGGNFSTAGAISAGSGTSTFDVVHMNSGVIKFGSQQFPLSGVVVSSGDPGTTTAPEGTLWVKVSA